MNYQLFNKVILKVAIERIDVPVASFFVRENLSARNSFNFPHWHFQAFNNTSTPVILVNFFSNLRILTSSSSSWNPQIKVLEV